MKTTRLITTIAFAFLMLLSFDAKAQNFRGLDVSPMDAAYLGLGNEQVIKVYYSRPQLKGRDLKSLTPNGKLWRTGANEGVALILNADMNLNGTLIKAGTYSLYTIPGDENWEVIVSSNINNLATRGYSEDNKVASISVPVTEGKESLEAFSMAFEKSDDGVHLHMGWGTMRIAVPFVLAK